MVAEQGEQAARPRAGRPRKWPSEAVRREHEAAKRRLRNKTRLTSEAFDDVVRLTALADDLQHRLDGAIKELEELRWRTRELERRLAEESRPGPTDPAADRSKAHIDSTPDNDEPSTAPQGRAGSTTGGRAAATEPAAALSLLDRRMFDTGALWVPSAIEMALGGQS